MSKSIKEVFPVIEKFVSKDALGWILKDCLSQKVLETIYHQCRLLPGPSPSFSPEIAAREISNEFFRNPKARELVAFYLDQETKKEVAWISSTSIVDIINKLREPDSPLIATGKVGRYLWSLLVDERPDSAAVVPIFILKVLETVKKFTQLLNESQKGIPSLKDFRSPPKNFATKIAKESAKTNPEISSLKKELDDAIEENKKLLSKNSTLEERVRDLQDQHKISLSELQALKHEKNLFLKKMRDLEQNIKETREQYKDYEEFRHQYHLFERENKILRYEIEKKGNEKEIIQSLKKEIEISKKTIQQQEKKIEDLNEEYRRIEDKYERLKNFNKQESLVKKAEAKSIRVNAVPRVGIFVDVQNIFYAAKEKYERKLDFQKLLHVTLQGRKLAKAIAYLVKTPEINQSNFISTLEDIGYEIKAKNLKIRLDGSAKGDWDLGIAIDTINLSEKIDVVVLVSGDGDFVDLVKMLKSKNIRVEVASFPHNTSGDLIDAVDLHYELDEKILLSL